ncbi:hypothetical protein RchiOBHm_Chr1g0326291 [Rosa chinensis]|uniref:Uncharacterized protein n=1 Tax=Rosa chinensis TaxID=74649 RepID=A0A2P6SA85_ROSCH|nr:hypothetical protein RchiOBHm_Chr1g0326291 [Rosa chinensis]
MHWNLLKKEVDSFESPKEGRLPDVKKGLNFFFFNKLVNLLRMCVCVLSSAANTCETCRYMGTEWHCGNALC